MDNYMQPQMLQVQQPSVLMQDPFAGVPGGSMSLPANTPLISDSPQMIDSLLSTNGINKSLADEYFWTLLRDIPLGFQSEDSKQVKMIAFDLLKIDKLNTTPWYDYTFDEELKSGIMRNVYEFRIDRALGTTNSQQKNERTVEQSQFSESRQISQHEDPLNYQREGFVQKLLRMRQKR